MLREARQSGVRLGAPAAGLPPRQGTPTHFGADHPKVAIRLNNLAQLLQDTNRLAEAEPIMRRALAIDEASFGADHPNVANRIHNLACLLVATERREQALPLWRRALAIFTASLGVDHPYTKGVQEWLDAHS